MQFARTGNFFLAFQLESKLIFFFFLIFLESESIFFPSAIARLLTILMGKLVKTVRESSGPRAGKVGRANAVFLLSYFSTGAASAVWEGALLFQLIDETRSRVD